MARKILVVAAVVLVGLIPNWGEELKTIGRQDVKGTSVDSTVVNLSTTPELAANILLPELTAKSILAYDYQTGTILYARNFDQRVSIASLTKLVTALVVMDTQKLNRVITVQPEDIRVIGGNMGLIPGEKVLASDVLKAMLIASSNDAAQVLAAYYGGTQEQFVKLMNDKAKQLGLTNTHFTNPVGLDDDDLYSTAQDLSKVVAEFTKNEELSKIVQMKDYEVKALNVELTHKIRTTNKLLLEDNNVVGIKTGYTSNANGNLIIRSKKGSADVVTIVLGSENREEDTKKLLEWIYEVYIW